MMNVNVDHDARRYQQIAHLERRLSLKESEIGDAKSHVKELEKERDGIYQEIRLAARDEGELPLLDLMEEVVSAKKH